MSEEKKYKWTVMAYLAGDNNLTDECVYSLTEMRKAVDDNVKVIAQFDPQDNYLPTQRYEIGRSGKAGSLSKDVVDHGHNGYFDGRSTTNKFVRRPSGVGPNEVATADPKTLYNFISWCVESYPAEHYMVVLSGHGGGIQKDYLLRDDSPDGYLTIPEMKWVFREIQKNYGAQDGPPVVDILGLDVCVMSMAEICYQLRGLAGIMVSSESYSPAAGWPYGAILKRLSSLTRPATKGRKGGGQGAVPADFARAIVEEHINFYAPYTLGGLSVDQSALDLSKVDELNERISELADELERELKEEYDRESGRGPDEVQAYRFRDALILAHWEAQSYNGELYVDIADFCDCLAPRCGSEQVRAKCEQLSNFISGEFVLKSCYSGPAYQYSHGVSIYFPWADIVPEYGNLDFARRSSWGRFIKTYTLLTRRAPRRPAGDQKGLINLYGGFAQANVTNTPRDLRMVGDKMVGDKMVGDKGSPNPMHSMRNPPIIALPSTCVGEKVISDQESLLSLFQ